MKPTTLTRTALTMALTLAIALGGNAATGGCPCQENRQKPAS
jgi:hypothetical protein